MAGRDFADCQGDLTVGQSVQQRVRLRHRTRQPNRGTRLRFGAWHPDWMLLRDALGACIRRARLDRGRSLREVAEQAGVSLSHLSADNIPDG